MQILIDGVDRTGNVDLSTLQVTSAIGERSTARFTVNDLDNSLGAILVPGETVDVIHCGDKKFGGTIDVDGQIKVSATGPRRRRLLRLVDWHQVCDRRIVAETYENTHAGAIVRDLVDKYLAVEGITYTLESIQDGPLVIECVFNYVNATTCLDTLAERAGFWWRIDPNKVLHFAERATYYAPWVLDDPSKVNNLQIQRSRQGLRNRQYVKAGKDVTDPQTETFAGDGQVKTYTLGFPIAKVPTAEISLDGGHTWLPQTVGIKGIDTDKDWYWNKGDPTITQDGATEPLPKADSEHPAGLLKITYQGLFDVVVLTDDYHSIEQRKAIEGGTGFYEAVDDEPYLSSREAAIQSANAKLRKYSKIAKTITFDTWRPGLEPGRILRVNLPDRELANEEFLIDQIVFSRIGGEYWNYAVTAVSGESLGGWTRFFRNMATRGQAFVIRENIREDQVLIRLVQSQEGWRWTEAMPVTVHACPIPSENLYPSSTLYPC